MNKNTARTVAKHGLALCQRAYALSRDGEGCSTIGIYLGVHWKTADGLVNAGRELAATPFNEGDAAVWTRPDGSSQSVIVAKVCPFAVKLTWATSRTNADCFILAREDWGQLTLFPAGCKFLAV